MTKFSAALLVLGWLLNAPSAASGFEQLKEIRPHSAAELSTLLVAANKGDAKAQLEYGKALVYLHGDPKNGVAVADYQKWFRKAADQGSGEAWFWLGYTTVDQTLLRTSYEHAAELGFAPAFDDVLDQLLFRAGEQADVMRAKHFADLARQKGIMVYDATEMYATVDHCYAAGKAAITDAERAAIAKDGRTEDSFTPNDNMRFAEAFANGWGVTRDNKRAIAFLCHASDVSAELKGMVKTLVENANTAAPTPFTFCDHVTSGIGSGQCESFVQDKIKMRRDQRLSALTNGFTPEQKRQFEILIRIATAYFETHARDEQDMSGTLRGAFYADEMGAMEQRFYEAIDGFEHGKTPAKDDFITADKELNTLYRNILKDTDWTLSGTVKPEGVRAAELAWLKYRDAWAVFGPLRYPTTDADTWKAWATRERIGKLKDGFSQDR